MTGVRIPAELDAKLRAWIARQPEPRPSRSEAIRRLLERAIGGGGKLG
jgi:Arc/MetJ-type ribon-helix-helix transcriptional regulator